MSRPSFLPTLVILSCATIWGSTWLAIKYGLDTLPPFLFASVRFAVAFVFLALWMGLQRVRWPRTAGDWRVMFVLGIILGVDYALVFWGEQFIESGIAAVLFSTMPFFVIVLSRFLLPDQPVTSLQVVGILFSFGGVVLIFFRDVRLTSDSVWGDAAMIGAAAFSALLSVYAKKHATGIHPVANTTVQVLLATLILLALGAVAENPDEFRISSSGWIAIVYLGLFGSAVAFVLYMWVIQKVSAVEASIIPVVSPLIAVLIGWATRDEALSSNVWMGGTLIVAGILFVNILPQIRHSMRTSKEAA